MDLRQGAYRALGPLRTPGGAAEIRQCGFPDRMVVGQRAGGADQGTLVKRAISNVTRRHTLALAAGAVASLTAAGANAQDEPEQHGISAFGDLKYPAGFKHFDYVE